MGVRGESPITSRIRCIDGARGVAMLLVFVAHFSDAYFGLLSPVRHGLLSFVTRVASPAFVWISGIMLGLLYHRNRENFAPMRDRLVDRGLFLILVGHPLIAGAMPFMSSVWSSALRVLFITDTIGVSLIVGAVLIAHVQARTMAVMGAATLLTSWVLVATWIPALDGVQGHVKALLIGDWRGDWLAYNFPPLPWLGFYLTAASLGRLFARLEEQGQRRRLQQGALCLGLGSMATALLLKGALHALAGMAAFQRGSAALIQLGSIREKLPPSPGYILFYGGLALLLFAAILAADSLRWGARFNRWAALFGRCSLACFVAQFYVYYVGVYLLPRVRPIVVPVYFLATLALLRLFASAWNRARANRFITVGYPGLAQRWSRRLQQRRQMTI